MKIILEKFAPAPGYFIARRVTEFSAESESGVLSVQHVGGANEKRAVIGEIMQLGPPPVYSKPGVDYPNLDETLYVAIPFTEAQQLPAPNNDLGNTYFAASVFDVLTILRVQRVED